jgi:WD40 repeat protein
MSCVPFVRFSGDGRFAATGGDDGTVHFWDAATGRTLGLPVDNRRPIRSLALAPDAQTILVGSWLESSRLWDIATAKPIGPPIRHQDFLLAAAFLPDASQILSLTADKALVSDLFRGGLNLDDGQIGLWIKVATCMELDARVAAVLLEPETWESYRRQLQSSR